MNLDDLEVEALALREGVNRFLKQVSEYKRALALADGACKRHPKSDLKAQIKANIINKQLRKEAKNVQRNG